MDIRNFIFCILEIWSFKINSKNTQNKGKGLTGPARCAVQPNQRKAAQGPRPRSCAPGATRPNRLPPRPRVRTGHRHPRFLMCRPTCAHAHRRPYPLCSRPSSRRSATSLLCISALPRSASSTCSFTLRRVGRHHCAMLSRLKRAFQLRHGCHPFLKHGPALTHRQSSGAGESFQSRHHVHERLHADRPLRQLSGPAFASTSSTRAPATFPTRHPPPMTASPRRHHQFPICRFFHGRLIMDSRLRPSPGLAAIAKTSDQVHRCPTTCHTRFLRLKLDAHHMYA
jgi:hypothetical protein